MIKQAKVRWAETNDLYHYNWWFKKNSKYVMMDNAHFWKNWNLAYYSKCNSGLSTIIDFLRIRKYNEVSVYLKQNDEAAAMICYLDFNQQSRNKYIFGIIQCISSKRPRKQEIKLLCSNYKSFLKLNNFYHFVHFFYRTF